MRILSIGYGNMGRPFVEPLLKDPRNSLSVITPNTIPQAPIKHFKSIEYCQDDIYDMIIFSCKPYQVEEIINKMSPDIYNDDTLFVSILAGTPREYYYSKLGANAKVALIMPNLPCKLGKGVLGVLYEEELPIFDCLGKLIYVQTQDDINKVTAMFGSGSGFVYHILASYKKALADIDIQFNDLSTGVNLKDLTLELFEGSIELARRENQAELET